MSGVGAIGTSTGFEPTLEPDEDPVHLVHDLARDESLRQEPRTK